MSNIKVFLVEDEIVIRKGICNSIKWEEEGYELVGEAGDGELAYPMILKEKPDILITDVKMPFMNGLELSKLVKKELPDIKIVVLSGYDDFEYAKEAISIGVAEYLLKPISSIELIKTLGEIRKQIEKEQQQQEALRLYSEETQENIELEKTKFFWQMTEGALSTSEIFERGKNFQMNLSASLYQVILLKIFLGVKEELANNEYMLAFEEFQKLFAEDGKVFVFWRHEGGWAFLVMAEDEAELEDKIQQISSGIEEFLKQHSSLEYFGGIGSSVRRIKELNKSLTEAEMAFAERFNSGSNQIIAYDKNKQIDLEGNVHKQGFAEIDEGRILIERFLKSGTEEELDGFVALYLTTLSAGNFASSLMRQYIMMNVYSVIVSFYRKMELDLKEEEIDLQQTIQQGKSLEEIKKFLRELLKKAILDRDSYSQKRYASVLEVAKEEMRTNYMTDSISLNSVAAKIGMSPSYFSSVFSKEEGMTFVEYLSEIRMEKAKELLMCTTMKTSEICYEVGYKDPHYFSYIFKKTQGCSPKEYRSRGREE